MGDFLRFRVRAERRAGEFLSKIPRGKPGPGKDRLPRETYLQKALDENDILPKEAYQWQNDGGLVRKIKGTGTGTRSGRGERLI
jgi:hypothetical protein